MMRGELRGKLIDATRSYTAEVEKERDYWHEMAKSYEHTILKFKEAAKENADAVTVNQCRDCALFDPNWECGFWHWFTIPEWFCQIYKEKEEEEENDRIES